VDKLSYRVGFEDALDALVEHLRMNGKLPADVRETIGTLVDEVRRRKAREILDEMRT